MSYGPPPPPQPPQPGSHPPLGPGLAIAALILGLLACTFPLLPFNLDRWRQFVAFPPAVGGLVLAIGACTGHRRAKPLAVIAVVVCVLGLGMTVFMVAGRA
ncbi:hypothetical protein [Streptomyces marispadix]|uniref:hypothetical protein n=1 Tax=Streptomyces marispadix TaxID=2922868 RepID=UPI002402C0C9|nr:hypothetical protein [Streptomyces marispadix]